jgi:hypothetical protein
MPMLRYVAFLADEPEKIADFYHRFLGTEELGRSVDGDVSITDGFYNLTFFKRRAALGEMWKSTTSKQSKESISPSIRAV